MKNKLYFLKDLLIFTVGIAIIASAVLIVNENGMFSNSRLVASSQMKTLEKKREIISIISKPVLSLDEKEKIGREITGDKAKVYGFSEEELKVIINAINK